MNRHVWTLLIFGLLIPTYGRSDDATKKDLEKLQGTWKLEEQPAGDSRLIIEGDRVTVAAKGQQRTGRLKLNANEDPKIMDIIWSDGREVLGIYELSGDRLKLCSVPASDGDRPEEFKNGVGGGQKVTVFRRVTSTSNSARKEDAAENKPDVTPKKEIVRKPAVSLDEANKKDLEKLQGTWKMVASEKDGRPQDMRKIDQQLVFRGTTITFVISGKKHGPANIRIDATKTPKELDVFGESPKDPVMLVIYEVEGDTLKFGWVNPTDQDRMEDFETMPGAEQRVQTYKRVTDK